MKEELSVRMKNNFYAKHSLNGRSGRVDTKGEDLTKCTYYIEDIARWRENMNFMFLLHV